MPLRNVGHARFSSHGSRKRRRHGLAAALGVLVVAASFLTAGPANAVPGSQILGHRCHLYDAAVTNEDTVSALIDDSKIPGTSCEIDTWKLADGTMIIWHDSTWGRVADHSTLPASIKPTDSVKNATWAQVKQIRTKGGQPVSTLDDMIAASGKYHVPLVVEIRNSVTNPTHEVQYATQHGAQVAYYQFPAANCATGQINTMYAAGAKVGIKAIGSTQCQVTPSLIQARHASFITDIYTKVTKAYMQQLASVGCAYYAMGAADQNALGALHLGAAKVMVNYPTRAATW
jgi:glycerophosphoryl diester phosphodiesterase